MEDKIIVYTMESCPDCRMVKNKLKEDKRYQIIDIGKDVRDMKRFILLRDRSDAFADARKNGYIGIPCIVYPDGKVSLDIREIGVEKSKKKSCRLDDKSGC